MSRPIEFMVWNGYSMVYPTIGGGEGCDKPVDLNAEIASLQKSGLVFLQFTGLLDKNGKKIFEGSILQSPATFPDGGVESWNRAIPGKMEFNCGCCSRIYGWHIPFDPTECEVIGNIYENPELLKIHSK